MDGAATSLQERYAPASACFGCGPANAAGLRIASYPTGDGSGRVVASWQPLPQHAAFPGVLNGGIIATLLDCHSNWAAAVHLMRRLGLERPRVTVTAAIDVRLLRPTPTGRELALEAIVVDASDRRAVVESSLRADGDISATARATFVLAPPGHPAYEAWAREANPSSTAESSSGR